MRVVRNPRCPEHPRRSVGMVYRGAPVLNNCAPVWECSVCGRVLGHPHLHPHNYSGHTHLFPRDRVPTPRDARMSGLDYDWLLRESEKATHANPGDEGLPGYVAYCAWTNPK